MLHRFGRVLAAASVVLCAVLFSRSRLDSPTSAADVALMALLVLGAVAAAAAWFSDWIGGGMLVVTGVALAACVGVAAEQNATTAILAVSVPFILAGLSLLAASALSEQQQDEQEEIDLAA
jgi:hypothetical protein